MTLALRSFDDWRALARRRLPRSVFDYIDRGVGAELALRRDRDRLDAVTLTPQMLRGRTAVDRSVTAFGAPAAAPLAIAPTAMAGLVHHDGEIALARAAQNHGLPFCLSTQSITSVDRLRAAVPEAEIWMQLYVWEDWDLTLGLLSRARDAGARVLMPTVDTPKGARKDWNDRRGFGMPFRWTARTLADIALHAPWALRVMLPYLLAGGMPRYANYPKGLQPSLTQAVANRRVALRLALDWDDMARLREAWSGPLVLKGICHPEDAARAVALGADGIVVSSHGGRNFDPCPAVIDLLPEVRRAVGQQIAVWADSGVRRGTDVVKYLAHGADGVLTGRLPLWGLAAAGAPGADTALAGILQELDEALILSGHDLGTLRALWPLNS